MLDIFVKIAKYIFPTGEIFSTYLVYVCHSWLAELLMWKLCQMASFISHSQQLRISFGYFRIWWDFSFCWYPTKQITKTGNWIEKYQFCGFHKSLGSDKTFIVGLCCCIWAITSQRNVLYTAWPLKKIRRLSTRFSLAKIKRIKKISTRVLIFTEVQKGWTFI